MKIETKICWVVFLLVAGAVSGCFQLIPDSDNTVIKTTYNPSKTKQAIIFLKDGNATSGQSFQVSIKNSSDELGKTEARNTFTTDGDHGKVVPDSSSISLSWKSDSRLLISYDKRLRTFIKSDLVEGINVEYYAR